MGVLSKILGKVGGDAVAKIAEAATEFAEGHLGKKELVLAVEKIQAERDAQLEQTLRTEMGARERVLVAEAQSESWITRSWRPIAMLTFVSIIPFSYLSVMFDWPAVGPVLATIPAKVWTMITVGLGAYIPFRSVDKAIKNSNGNGIAGVLWGKKIAKAKKIEGGMEDL